MKTESGFPRKSRRGRLVKITLIIIAALVVMLLGLEGWIKMEANNYAKFADKMINKGKIHSLAALINSPDHSLEQKNLAVWALGELKGKEALPELESHLTGKPCNHKTELCQYEFKKAILKIKGKFRGSWQAKSEKTFPD